MLDKIMGTILVVLMASCFALLGIIILGVVGIIDLGPSNPCTRPALVGKVTMILDRNDGWYDVGNGSEVYCQNGRVTDTR